MSDKRFTLILRAVLIAIGLGFVLWALSDDYLIGGGPGFGLFQGFVLAVGMVAFVGAFMSVKVVTSVLTSIVSLSIGLAIIEGALVLFLSPRLSSIYELDSEYLYKFKPNSKREYVHLPENGGTKHTYRINSDGFRGEELRVPSGSPRVVVYGDSFIHAEFSLLESTYAKQLEEELIAAGHPDAEVINAGVAGYGPDQILIRLSKELGSLEPDLVIISIFSGNDFGDLLRNKLFRLDKNGDLVRNGYSFDPEIIFQAELADRELLIRRALRNVRDLFVQQREITDREASVLSALNQHKDEYDNYIVRGDNVVRELRSDPYSADIAMLPESISARYKVELMEAVMAGISSEAENLPVLFILIPHPIDLMKGDHESGRVNSVAFPQYSPDQLTGELFRICTRQKLQCINLMDLFRSKGGESLFLKGGDDHWNSQGQRIAAKATAEFIRTSRVLELVAVHQQ